MSAAGRPTVEQRLYEASLRPRSHASRDVQERALSILIAHAANRRYVPVDIRRILETVAGRKVSP